MGFTKYTNVEEILEIKSSKNRLVQEGLSKFAALDNGIRKEDGYLYVRCRAISSRVNKNNDGWPSEELMKAADSFVGRPIFVDHNNDNPRRTRGVIVESQVHVEDDEKVSAFDEYYASAPDNHKPPTWIELLMEVDAKTYPKLATAIEKGDIDAVSMGANIDLSICSVCANEATSPDQYCNHIQQKGITFEIEGANGERVRKKAYEDCYGIVFFEESFVFDPADPTADAWLDKTSNLAAIGAIEEKDGEFCIISKNGNSLGCFSERTAAEQRLREVEKFRMAKSAAGVYNYEDDELELEDPPEFNPGYDPDDTRSDQELVVYEWRYEQLLRAGADPEVADELARHPLVDLHQAEEVVRGLVEQGKPTQIAVQVLAKAALAKVSKIASPAEQFIEPVDGESDRTKNHEPQSDKTTAPEHVDTLRNEQLCPICKAANMEADPDGIVRCPTCGHVQEPAPVDNPDLSRAKDIDRRLDVSETTTPEGDVMVPGSNPSQEMDLNRITFEPLAANISAGTNEGISEMFNVKLRTESKEEADKALPIRMAKVERKLGAGISPAHYKAAAENRLRVKLSYPAVDDRPNTLMIPGRNGLHNLFLAQESSQRLNVPVNEVPIVIEAQDEETLEKFIALLDVEAAAEKQPILQPSEEPKDEPSKETVIDDQNAPVEASVKLADGLTLTDDAGATFTLNRTEDGGWAVAPKAESEEEEADESEEESEDESKEEEKSEPAAEKESAEVAEVDEDAHETKLLAAFELADMAVEMGLVDSKEKMAHIASLEELSVDALEARKSALEEIKNAGLAAPAPRKVAGVRKVPRIASAPTFVSSKNGSDPVDPFGDADLFM